MWSSFVLFSGASNVWKEIGGTYSSACETSPHSLLPTSTEWLDDDLIAAAQNLLKKHHPAVEGLQPPAVALTGTMQQPNLMASKYLQILHVNSNHRIVVSTLQSAPGSINVYDSMSTHSHSSAAKESVVRLLQGQQVSICYEDVQQQRGGDDCGLFAIAFSASLCEGEDPTKLHYQQDRMRQHLRDCLEKGEITSFPSSTW